MEKQLHEYYNGTALVVVDLQNDFCPGDSIIPFIESLMKRLAKEGTYICATRDWHPRDHVSFKTWPVHCVANTPGAGFHKDFLWPAYVESVFSKGEDNRDDGYSGVRGTNLLHALSLRGVKKVRVVGLTTDWCVKATALDLRREGLEVEVILNGCRAVNINPDDEQKAIDEMKAAGINIAARS
jgi:nicotinamidase/pyrazinamidase